MRLVTGKVIKRIEQDTTGCGCGYLGMRQSIRITALQEEQDLAGCEQDSFRMKRDSPDGYLSG